MRVSMCLAKTGPTGPAPTPMMPNMFQVQLYYQIQFYATYIQDELGMYQGQSQLL